MKRSLITLVATGLYSGYGRPYPGTWGTVPALLIAYFLIAGNQWFLAAAVVVTTVVSVWSSGIAESWLGHDARKIVIDEWAGMFLTLLFVPYSPLSYGIAFAAFRLFDVVKLPPAAQLERLPGGWGITLDDIAAGVYANVFTRLILLLLVRFEFV